MTRNRSRWLSAWVFLGLSGCVGADPGVGVSREALRVSGDWEPPASVLAASGPQVVEVVEPPAVLPLGSCTSTNPWEGTCTHPACTRAHPGTTELDAYIRARWPYVRAGGTYSCRRNSNPASTEYLSVHSVGRAIDLMITQIDGDADNTAGDAVANWLIENAEYIGIQRVIWDGQYWNGSRRNDHFREISDATETSSGRSCGGYCTDHHTNHIHVELSVAGAARTTRFFTDGAPPARDVLDAVFVASDFPGFTTIEVPVGEEVHGCLGYRNLGTVEWVPGTTRLGTTVPRDHASPFPGSDWLSPSRLATVEARTAPGGTGQFCFSLAGADAPGTRDERFSLVQELAYWAVDTGGVSDETNVVTVVTVAAPATLQTPDAGLPDAAAPDAAPQGDGAVASDAGVAQSDGGSSTAARAPRAPLAGSCRAAPGTSTSPGWALLVLAALAALGARRRRSP